MIKQTGSADAVGVEGARLGSGSPSHRTSVRDPPREQYPYLLMDREIAGTGGVGGRHCVSADAAGSPVSGSGHGLVQPSALVVEVVSNTLDAGFCVEVLNESLKHYGGLAISMDGSATTRWWNVCGDR